MPLLPKLHWFHRSIMLAGLTLISSFATAECAAVQVVSARSAIPGR